MNFFAKPMTIPSVQKTFPKIMKKMGLETIKTDTCSWIIVDESRQIGTVSFKITPDKYTMIATDALGVANIPVFARSNTKYWKDAVSDMMIDAVHYMHSIHVPKGYVINPRWNDMLRQIV